MSEVPLQVVRVPYIANVAEAGRHKAIWKREFKLPWREAGPPNHHDDKVDSDEQVVNKELSLSRQVERVPYIANVAVQSRFYLRGV